MKYVNNLRVSKPEVDPMTLEEVEPQFAAASGQDTVILTVLIFLRGYLRTKLSRLFGATLTSTGN
jgi:hypothetical protein